MLRQWFKKQKRQTHLPAYYSGDGNSVLVNILFAGLLQFDWKKMFASDADVWQYFIMHKGSTVKIQCRFLPALPMFSLVPSHFLMNLKLNFLCCMFYCFTLKSILCLLFNIYYNFFIKSLGSVQLLLLSKDTFNWSKVTVNGRRKNAYDFAFKAER